MKELKDKMKILFVYDSLSSFVKKDLELFQKHFDVKPVQWKIRNLLKIISSIMKSDLTFSWFAGRHSAFAVFFSKIYRKKSIVIVGGYDAAYLPELKYGAFTKFIEKLPAMYVYKNVDKILVVDPSLKTDIINNAKVGGSNINYLPTGYNPNFWKSQGNKKNIVLTVALATNPGRIKLKGLDTFIITAKYVNDAQFIIIGVSEKIKKYLGQSLPNNLELINVLPKNELLQYYQSAKVYCQLSIREGLPNTLCEAMLCECIPVGTKRYGIATAIGDAGFYVPYGDPDATADAIKKGLAATDELGKKARERIKTMFSAEKREKELIEIIRSSENR